MPIRSRETVELPLVSIPTFLFESPVANLSKEPIILDPESPDTRQLSLHSYRYWSQRLAAGLRDAGLSPGERVLFLSQNSTAWPIVFMGILMAGGVFSGQSPAISIAKLVLQASQVQPSFILVSDEGCEVARTIARQIQLSEDYIYLFDDTFLFENKDPQEVRLTGNERHWAELLKETSVPFDWRIYTASNQLAAINYTSGSTGNAKGVLITHYNFVANSVQDMKHQSQDPLGPEQGKRCVWVMWTSMYHVLGLTQFCVTGPKRGVVNYIMPRFDLETMLRYTERYEATTMFLLPAVLIAMLTLPAFKDISLRNVHTLHVGGAPLRESLIRRLRDMMPNESVRFLEGWGMTELTALAISRSPLLPDHVRTHGELLPNCEGKIMDPDGTTELGPDKAGELYIKAPNVAQGYACLPEVTKRTFLPDGWLRTGDLAMYDTQGNWYIKDRIQDIIYHESGSYCLPTDLESTLINTPGVKDAGIALVKLGTDSERKVPRAFVVLDSTKQPDITKVQSEFSRGVGVHEQLRGGIFEIENIPRLPSGKVDRVLLSSLQVSIEGMNRGGLCLED